MSSNQSQISTPPKCNTPPKISRLPKPPPISDTHIQLLQQNKRLRKKLKQLSARIDLQLERAAKGRLKVANKAPSITLQSQSVQLQNAYKMIERLQKSVKDYQNKDEYQINFKRITQLQSIMKKRQSENEELKQQIKDAQKQIKDKEKYINELTDKQSVNYSKNDEKDRLHQLKREMKTARNQNQELKKRQLERHKKLVEVQRKLVQFEQEQEKEKPVAKQEELLNNYEKEKAKYQDAMTRIQKQNVYIAKLHIRLAQLEELSMLKKQKSYSISSKEAKHVAKSVNELPDLSRSKIKTTLLEHIIPSPNLPSNILKRY